MIRSNSDRKMTLESRIARLEKFLVNESAEDGSFKTAHDVMMAIEDGWDPDTDYGDGFTALMSAAIDDNVAVTRALIRAGADVNAMNRNGSTPLDFAIANDSKKVEDVLVRAGAELGEDNQERERQGFGAYRGHRNPYGRDYLH